MTDYALKLKITAENSGVSTTIQEAESAVKKLGDQAQKTGSEAQRLNNSMKDLSGGFDHLRFAVQGLLGAWTIKEFIDANATMQAMNLALKQVTGSSQLAAQEMTFVRGEASRLGLSLQVAVKQYTDLYAASKGSALQGEATKKIFSDVSEVMLRLGRSSSDVESALLAVQQMMSKGTVQTQELKLQLGNVLPGAFEIAARAAGVTTQAFAKMLETGEVISADFIPKFASQIETEFNLTGASVESFNASVGRLKTAWVDLLTAIGNTGAFDSVSKAIDLVGAKMESFAQHINYARAAFKEFTGTMDVSKMADAQLELSKLQQQLTLLESARDKPSLIDRLIGSRSDYEARISTIKAEIELLNKNIAALSKTTTGSAADFGVYTDKIFSIDAAFKDFSLTASKSREEYIKLWKEGLSPVQKAYQDLQDIKIKVVTLDATEAEKTSLVADYQAKYDKALQAANKSSETAAKQAASLAEHQETVIDKLKEQILTMDGNRESALKLEYSHKKLTEAQQDWAVKAELYIKRTKEMRDIQIELMKAEAQRSGKVAAAIEQIQIETKQLTMSNDERERQNRLLASGIPLWDENAQKIEAMIAQEQALAHQMDLMKDIGSGIKDSFVEAFQTIFEKGSSGFKDLVDKIKSWFIKMLADLTAMALAKPVLVPILTTVGGALGISNPAQAAQSIVSNMSPYGTGAPPGTSSLFNYLPSWFSGTPGNFAPMAGTEAFGPYGVNAGLSGFGGNTGGVGSYIGAIAPYAGAGLAGWGLGGMAAGWYGGNTLGGNIGGALGGIGGMAAGTALAGTGMMAGASYGAALGPIGMVVGAILGGLLGGLFGGGEPSPFRLSIGTNKSFPYRGTERGYEDYTSAQGPFGPVGFLLRGNNNQFDAAAQQQFLDGLVQIDAAFAQFLNPHEVQQVKDKLANLNELEFKNSFDAIAALKQRFGAMLEAVDPQLAKLYDTMDVTADTAGSFATSLLGLRQAVRDLDTMISGPQDPVQAFIQQIQALDAALNDAAQAGRAALTSGDPTQILQAEQQLQQAVVNRYQYEMQVATQLQATILQLQDAIKGLEQQVYQMRVSFYQDWLAVNQRIQQTGGSGVTQLDIYRRAGAELFGAYQGETDPAARLTMLRQGMDIVDQALAARMAEIDQWAQEQQQIRQQHIDALNQEKAAIQAAASARIDALNQELASTQQLAQLLPSITQAIDSMRYGGANPMSAFYRLGSAQSDLAGETDPARRLQLLQTIMGLAGEAYQRPSREYQNIYNQVISELTGLQNEAQAASDHAAQIQDQIAQTTAASAASLASIDQQVGALADMSDIQEQVKQLQDEANREANSYYQWIRDQGAAVYGELQDVLAGQISTAQEQLDVARAQMDALTQGLGYQDFMANKQAEMAAVLTQIRDALLAAYSGTPAPVQQAQLSKAQLDAAMPYITRQIKRIA
jgi:tape measure domain-containing protein